MIRSSYNVSSITKNGTGDYTVNLATAMADANYAVGLSLGANGSTSAAFSSSIVTINTAQVRLRSLTVATSPVVQDSDTAAITIFGN
jgi:hypothetical protein